MAVNLGSVFATLELNTKNFKEGLNKAAGATSNFQKDLGKAGAALTKNVTLPLVALGTAGVAAFISIEKAQKRIIIGTGVTGEAMEDMMSIVRRLAVRVPQGFEDVGIAVAEVNTRLGVTGQDLEDLSWDMLDFARITGVDVVTATTNVGRLFNALELDANELGGTLDKLTFASQKTGIASNDLINYIIDAGPAFEELGFGLDESIALFSQFEAAGARPQEVISSINILLNRMANEGVTDGREAMERLIEEIKAAPSIFEATTIASEAFGARVGAKVAEDMRNGRFEIEDFVNALENAGGTFHDTATSSLTFTEELSMLKNEIVLLLEPLGKELVVVLREDIMPLLRTLIDFVSDLTQRFSELDDRTKEIIIIFAGVLAILGPTLVIISKVIIVVKGLAVFLGALFTAVKVVIGILSLKIIAIGLVIAAIAFLAYQIVKNWDKIIAVYQKGWDFIKNLYKMGFDFVRGLLEGFYNKVREIIDGVFGIFKDLYNRLIGNSLIPDLINGIVNLFGRLPSLVGEKLSELFNVFGNWFGKMWESAKDAADNIRERISNAFNVKERNSPSILDRLQELKAASESVMGNIQVPNFAGDISSSLASINPQISGNLAVSGGSPNLTVNVGMYAGSALEKRQIAKELNEALADYEKGVGLTI